MKLFALLFAFIPFFVSAQVNLTWSDQVIVNEDTDLGFTRPKIVLVNGNTPVVMWSRLGNWDVHVSRLEGNSFSNPLKITPEGMRVFSQNWAGPDMASNGNRIIVTYKSQPESLGFVYTVSSFDGGLSFLDTVRVSDVSLSRFPSVSIDPNGNPHVAYMRFEPGFLDPHYAVVNSTDGGKTFGSEVNATASASGEVCDCCPANIFSTHDNIYLLFRNNDNNIRDVWISVSNNDGSSFNINNDVDTSDWIINACPASGPVGIQDKDSVLFVWMSGETDASRIHLGTTDKNNYGTGVNTPISKGLSKNTNQNFPKIAGEWGNVGVVWQQSEAGKFYIMFRASQSGANGLMFAKTDTVNVGGAPSNPSLVYKNGTFHITWQDNNRKKVYYKSATMNNVTDLSDKSIRSKISLFPNPTTNKLTLKFSESYKSGTVSIRNSIGQIVLIRDITDDAQMDIDLDCPSGLYSLEVHSRNRETAFMKVVIQ